MNVTIRQLRAFVAVSALGSCTAAAGQLHVTQSALSVLIRELERTLGTRLFDRHTRSVRLTDAGRDYLPHVEQVFVELDAGAASVTGLRDKRRGLLRIGAPQLMACTLMPRVIAAFRGVHPAIEIRLVDTLPESTLQRLAGGDVELAIGPDMPAGAEFLRRPVLRDRHWLVCRPDHQLAAQSRVRWVDVARHPFVAPTRDFMKRLVPELAALPRPVRIEPAFEVSYMTTALGLAASGLGVTACPSYSKPIVHGYGLTMLPLLAPVFYREVCAFTLADRSLSPAADAFVATLHEVVRQSRSNRVSRRTANDVSLAGPRLQ